MYISIIVAYTNDNTQMIKLILVKENIGEMLLYSLQPTVVTSATTIFLKNDWTIQNLRHLYWPIGKRSSKLVFIRFMNGEALLTLEQVCFIPCLLISSACFTTQNIILAN